ncbi:hypothetical protein [Microvirga sp. TS319]|uniref:hypothetical protein n=1 Tax=Microvirga sp. TS319 TaxID=3241165 RepID=UPI00351A8904
MATVSQHAAAIVALAQQADGLVSQFRQLMANIEAEEAALVKEARMGGVDMASDAIAGRRRLGHYAHLLAGYPAGAALPREHSKTVTELATYVWSEFL